VPNNGIFYPPCVYLYWYQTVQCTVYVYDNTLPSNHYVRKAGGWEKPVVFVLIIPPCV